MTLWMRHSTAFEILIAFLSFGLVAFLLKSSSCRATSDLAHHRDTIEQFQEALNPNPRLGSGDRLSSGIQSLQHGDHQNYAGPYVDKQAHIPGDASVEPSSNLEREANGQWHSTSDQNLQTEHHQHYQKIQLHKKFLSQESKPQHSERNARDSEIRRGRRQLQQQTEKQPENQKDQPQDGLEANLEAEAVKGTKGAEVLQEKKAKEVKDEAKAKEETKTEVVKEGKEDSEVKEAEQETGVVKAENEERGESQEKALKETKQETGVVMVENDDGKESQETALKEVEQETGEVKDVKEEKEEKEGGKEAQEKPEKETAEEILLRKRKAADHYKFPEPYLLGPVIKDWDQQREKWLNENPQFRFTSAGKPRVLLVSGSSGTECPNGVGDDFYVKSLKLKIDYARVHNYELYYNLAQMDPLFTGFWVKLPTFRNLMLAHPEIEWIFWLDGDAVFTDVLFEAPLEEFDDYNMVMEGWFSQLMTNSWLAANDGVVLLRNCQWSLDLIDKWSPFGPEGPTRDLYGKMMTEFFRDREDNYPADDQAALSYLMITDEAVMSKIKLYESRVQMSAYWKNTVQNYENSMENFHPGLGDGRWPWVTHFTGCSLCYREKEDPELIECLAAFQRAYNFADNQILAYWGLQYKTLSGPELIRTRNETDRPLEFLEVNPWQERIDQLAAASNQ